MTEKKKKSTGAGIIKHLIERLQAKGFAGKIFRKALKKFLTRNKFEFEVFWNPNSEAILAPHYKLMKLEPLLPVEKVEEMDDLTLVGETINQMINPSFNDLSTPFWSMVIKLVHYKEEKLLEFVGPIPLSVDVDERLDDDPVFSRYCVVASKHARSHPGRESENNSPFE